jgi:adenine-specific DNA-methyltransferase
MASFFGPLPPCVRLLDAGAGAGALTSALVSRLSTKNEGVRSIDATLYELDPLIQDALARNMRDCQQRCARIGVDFSFDIHAKDFIGSISSRLSNDLFGTPPPCFDAAIVNPPYRKIRMNSPERRLLRGAGIEATNLYTGFIALIQRLLVPGGQIVGITPRSFCNGSYFLSFREDFLANLEIRRLHVFESREAAFRHDNVLQENIIFHAVRGRRQPAEIVISSSSGENGDAATERSVPFADVVHPRDPDKFIHIPSTACHALAKTNLSCLRSDLASLGVTVSTGRVVEFRLKSALRWEPAKGTVPLVHPCHFHRGRIRWPKPQGRKPNAILRNEETRRWLVRSGVYLLTKRFTSKEERRRLVACLLDPESVDADWLGFENHLNYFHANGHGLDRNLALGLFAFLNSTVVDQFFRRFSGHTQVNANDLRKLAYPDRKTLEAMAAEIRTLDLSQQEIDELVGRHIHARQ